MKERTQAIYALIGVIVLLVAIVAVPILAMVKGWGLWPVSWPWVIGCYAATVAVTMLGKMK